MVISAKRRRRRGWLLSLIGFVALGILLSTGRRGFLRQIRVQRERIRIEKEKGQLEAAQKQLQEEKKRLNDSTEVERIAREQYGMAKKNEKVLHVVPKEGKP
jgi:cell division protein FtsL